MSKRAEEQNTEIISTKVSPKQKEQILQMAKHMGFSSTYQMLQTILAVMAKYDQNSYDVSDDNYKQICKFIEPFVEIEDFDEYTKEYLAESGFGLQPDLYGKCPIEYVVVRHGKLVSKYYRDEQGNPKICHCADSIILDLIMALRPFVHNLVLKAMHAIKTTSFIEWICQSLSDQENDIKGMRDTDRYSIPSITYGIVPKQTRNKTIEGFDNSSKGRKKLKADNDYYADYDNDVDSYDYDDNDDYSSIYDDDI